MTVTNFVLIVVLSILRPRKHGFEPIRSNFSEATSGFFDFSAQDDHLTNVFV